jgi:cytidylate kinase
MRTSDLVAQLERDLKKLVYISGKTSTGKTTLARQLRDRLDYSIISFDAIVQEAVVDRFHITDVPLAYVVAYRDGEPSEWRDSFISQAKAAIDSNINKGLILEGAIANPETLHTIVSAHASDFIFVYIHPSDVNQYATRIRNRFLAGAASGSSGLPKDFWPLLPEGSLEKFKENHEITKEIEKAILDFSQKSQSESKKRLNSMHHCFENITVVDLLD